MLTTRGLLGRIQKYMPEVSSSHEVLEYLDRAYLRLCQNDIKDFVYVICAGDYDNIDLDFPYPVLKQKTTIGGTNPMPSCVPLVANNFTDDLGNELAISTEVFEFKYKGQIVTPRKVNAFFVKKNINNYYYPVNQTPYQPFSPYFNSGYGATKFGQNGNMDFSRFPCDLRPPSGDTPCEAYFFSKPYGDAESADESNNFLGDIYCEFWFTPPSLTTADSVMLLDVGKWQDELINGAVGYYEDLVNGDSTRKEKFLQFDRKEFMNEGNSNLHNRGNQQFIIRDIG
jgi:hypothetical protein|tara:strand:+ start:1242 stop:2093 length:852 start_codon:yes stop_codon:yes gene_type:complete